MPTVSTLFGPISYRLSARGALAKMWFGEDDEGQRSQELEGQVQEFFRRERTNFDFPLELGGTPFQASVWKELLKIPCGETRTYQQIANALGHHSATRAVGAANGANPVALVVPCHRVIGSNGKLTGYAGGLDVKARLLEFERGSLFEDELSV